MKTIVKFVLVAVMAIATTGQAFAQPQDKKQRMSREQLAEMQARHIADEMAFDDVTTEKFINTYTSCQKEVWALHPQRPHKDKGNKPEAMTEEQTEKAIKDRFEHSQKLLDIRQKYYAKYSKFLTQKQIERVYQLEQQMMRKLDKRRGRGHGKDGQRPQPQQPQQSK